MIFVIILFLYFILIIKLNIINTFKNEITIKSTYFNLRHACILWKFYPSSYMDKFFEDFLPKCNKLLLFRKLILLFRNKFNIIKFKINNNKLFYILYS